MDNKEKMSLLIQTNAYTSIDYDSKKKLYSKYIGIAYDVMEWVKTTPLLINFPWAEIQINLEYKKSVSGTILGGNAYLGIIVIYLNNIIYNNLDIKSIQDTITPDNIEINNDIVHRIIVRDIVHTIIHESFHMHYTGDMEKYRTDSNYRKSLEDRVEYSCYKFIERNIESLVAVTKTKFMHSKFLNEKINRITNRNEVIKEIEVGNPNTMALKIWRMSNKRSTDAVKCLTNLVYSEDNNKICVIINDCNGEEKLAEVVKYGGFINYAAINNIIESIRLHRIRCSKIAKSMESNTVFIVFGEATLSPIFKPVLEQIMVKVPKGIIK